MNIIIDLDTIRPYVYTIGSLLIYGLSVYGMKNLQVTIKKHNKVFKEVKWVNWVPIFNTYLLFTIAYKIKDIK